MKEGIIEWMQAYIHVRVPICMCACLSYV